MTEFYWKEKKESNHFLHNKNDRFETVSVRKSVRIIGDDAQTMLIEISVLIGS